MFSLHIRLRQEHTLYTVAILVDLGSHRRFQVLACQTISLVILSQGAKVFEGIVIYMLARFSSPRELCWARASRQDNIAAGSRHALDPSELKLKDSRMCWSLSSTSYCVHTTCILKCMGAFTTVSQWHLFSALCRGETCAASWTFFFYCTMCTTTICTTSTA